MACLTHDRVTPATRLTRLTGSLAGRIIGVKGNIVTNYEATSAASKVLATYKSPFDATVVTLLRQDGASILPDLNMDEFGMGSHSQHSGKGAVKSLYSRNGEVLSPGGSSGGSAVAVCQEKCWAALGTDTGGSVRLPAAYTGLVGFKPSYGLLSRWGVIQYANSLDTVGLLARNTADVRSLFTTLNKYDHKDPTSLSSSVRARLSPRSTPTSLRIGIPTEYNINEISSAVRATYTATLERLQRAGHTLIPISLPTTRLALSAYYILAPAEASSNLAKYDGVRYGTRLTSSLPTPTNSTTSDTSPASPTQQPLYTTLRGTLFGPEVRRRILLGAYTLSAGAMDNHFMQAQRVRRLVQQDFDRVFAVPNPLHDGLHDDRDAKATADGDVGDGDGGRVDVIMVPTAPTLPPTLEEVRKQSAVEGYMNDVFTVPASLAGLPAVSVPVPIMRGKGEVVDDKDVASVGVQVLGQFGEDGIVLDVAEMIEGMVRV